MSDKPQQPIIIKKIKKGGHGHHGGAWKVAYADFVTAMMAFFMLLWLLTATPVENLQGLADYFSPTIGLQGKMGIGFSGGTGTDAQGVSSSDWASLGLIFGAAPSGPIIKFPEVSNYIDQMHEKVNIDARDEEISEIAKESFKRLNDYKEDVLIDYAPEGLKIRIKDKGKKAMFKKGTSELTLYTKNLLKRIAIIIKDIPNYIKIISIPGHSDVSDKGYNNWKLSMDRSNATRSYLEASGVDEEQIYELVALAQERSNIKDKKKFSGVEIIVLRNNPPNERSKFNIKDNIKKILSN